MLFNSLVSNCDDHLIIHGFILEPTGWRLSPAYDINPMLYSHRLTPEYCTDVSNALIGRLGI